MTPHVTRRLITYNALSGRITRLNHLTIEKREPIDRACIEQN